MEAPGLLDDTKKIASASEILAVFKNMNWKQIYTDTGEPTHAETFRKKTNAHTARTNAQGASGMGEALK